MNFFDKQKVKSRLTIVAFGVFGLFIAWVSDVNAFESFFASRGCDAAGCHDGALPIATPTCVGCHAHGAHSNSDKGVQPPATADDMNITASTDATTYTVGDTIAITVDGGYEKRGWVRVIVYNDNGDVVAQSKGTCDSTTSSNITTPACSNGLSMPITLQVTANITGTQMWTASWYGNSDDVAGSTGGLNGTLVTVVTEPGWLEDLGNAGHGEEIVSIPSFTVNDAPPASSGGGGGSLSWSALGLLLLTIIGMLAKNRQTKLIPIRHKD
ncbi:MAG: hypothetical protein GXP19_04935 [Gammaproteobacteria bacterium]|nr:hypothetical protein [Gammaproteobacteria bacterium]